MGWGWKKYAMVSLGTALAGVAVMATGGLAAPFVGSMVGGAMGLSGAAATSAGLAAIGGGAIAVGGGGMAAGTAIVTATLATASAVTVGVASANLIDDKPKRCKACNSLMEFKDIACTKCGDKV